MSRIRRSSSSPSPSVVDHGDDKNGVRLIRQMTLIDCISIVIGIIIGGGIFISPKVLIVIINSLSVPLTRKIQVATSFCKVLGLIAIVVAGVYQLIKGNTSNIETAFSEGSIKWKTLPLAFYSGLYAYSGWEFLPSIAEEIINPGRTIPLAIIISVIFITFVYVLVNIAYFSVLNSAELLASSAVALDFGQRVFGNWSWILSVIVAISIAGNLNGGAITFARTLLVASREGHIPQVISMVHIDQKTPLPAAAALLPISIIMLVSGDVSNLINYTGFAGWAFTALTCAIIPYYRWKYPDLKRPFKVPLVIPIIFVCCALFLVVMSVYSSPVDCGIGLAITLLGIPVYYVGVAWKNKPKWFTNAMDNLTVFLQQLVMVVPQEDEERKERFQS